MKTRLGAALLALVLAAGTLPAAEMLTVLTPDGTLYAINPAGAKARLEVSRRRADVRETLVVPAPPKTTRSSPTGGSCSTTRPLLSSWSGTRPIRSPRKTPCS